VFFTNRNLTNSDIAMKQGRWGNVILFDQALASPSTFLPLALILAGLVAWKLNLIPAGLRTSAARVLGGAAFTLFLYPAGLVSILFVVLLAMRFHIGENWPNPNSPDWLRLVGYLPSAALLCLAGMFTIVLEAVAMALVTRWWPRRVFLWSSVTSAGVLICSFCFSLVRQKILFPTIPIWSHVVNYGGDMLVFSLIWKVEAPIIIGEPILAALLGHWFYHAAVAWCADCPV
jgi:hypothetical protein